MPSSDLTGKWTYRSFINDPTPVGGDPQKALDLIFAEAEFTFEAVSDTTFKGVIDCIKAFSETDFTEDLKKFDVPTLILHGDDDQIVPIGASALLSSNLVKGATLKVYPGAPHGMCSTLKDQVNAELVAFLKA